jgi:alpha-tubulin suppressor-like RCC1 family protein
MRSSRRFLTPTLLVAAALAFSPIPALTSFSSVYAGDAQIAATSFSSVYAGGAHTCALTAAGAAFCWGRGESGQLGVPPPPTTCLTDGGPFPCSMIPVRVGTGLAFTQLAGGGAHTCALTSNGTAFCWGNNASGQLGDGTTTNRDTPVPVTTALRFTSIDAGTEHTCALTSTSEAYCWGRNDRGQLGNGNITNSSIPVLVLGSSFQQIAAGGFLIGHTCGLALTGLTYCWGDNERGQLGIGGADLPDLLPHPLPMPVAGGLTFVSITAGLGRHSCGRTALGTVYCWGENSFGALGNGSGTDSPVPVQVAGGRTFSQVIAGGFIGHTCALTGTGDAYCWGENERGQVGDGTTVDRLAPEAVFGRLIFTSIDAGFRHTCGRDNTGTLHCWGANGAGQLGNNTNTLSTVPSKVFGPPEVTGPSLQVLLNTATFRPGETLTLTALLTPGLTPVVLDAYVVVQLPDRSFLSLQLGGGVVEGVVPIGRGLAPFAFTGELLGYTFRGDEPPGQYTWFAALTEPGTLNVVGPLDQVSFTFSP